MRKNCAIKSGVLQKRLVLDNSVNNVQQTMHNFIDLKSCCDCELANVRSIVKETVGQSRHVMKLFTKLMPKFKRCTSTCYGTSGNYYRGDQELLAGAGQVNKFSREMCRDVLCLIVCQIEIK